MQTKTANIVEYLLSRITSGEFAAGQKIPSQFKLMQLFNCSRITIQRALKYMVDNGYLDSSRGSGTFVRPGPYRQPVKEVIVVNEIAWSSHSFFVEMLCSFDSCSLPVRWVDQQFILRNSENFFNSSQIVVWMLPEERHVMLMYHLQSKKIPQLMINRTFGNFNHIYTDPWQGLSGAMDRFYAGREKDTAIVTWQNSPKTPYLSERLIAFYEECLCHGGRIKRDWIIKIPDPAQPEHFDAAGKKLFASDNFPRKLFIAEESMMPLIVMAAASCKRYLGKDYEVLVFSQGTLLKEQPGLFMIHQPMNAYRRAVENFISRTVSGDRSPYQVRIKSELRIPDEVIF